MSDKYVERQLKFYEAANSGEAKDDALYRLGTHLEVIPCNGNANLNDEQRTTILDAAKYKEGNDE
ncbi:hypothetical protein NIES4075_74200 [Tolypothrix sp. NIES-4075]|uniref:hypothetical protein n=1 Tax=Tolypothrix sp. NIES-4075 TaxID=2005459 RepID=UPI000B5CEEDC|nr:hypothetical protein [Tolypothrix sp. NIES-4075]GAX46396.1 hypothetical protein NIES4075_74200 [Tolypothrix sp. NIES-4075]